MSKLDPEKLSVEFRDGVTSTDPIIPRRYTLTHSDITAELFLTIGLSYAYDKISPMRDEVLGEWVLKGESYFCYIYLYVDGNDLAMTTVRNKVFRRELPLALEAIRYGDRIFFEWYPGLDYVPIVVFFLSQYEKYNKVENWGTFSNYSISQPISRNK